MEERGKQLQQMHYICGVDILRYFPTFSEFTQCWSMTIWCQSAFSENSTPMLCKNPYNIGIVKYDFFKWNNVLNKQALNILHNVAGN